MASPTVHILLATYNGARFLPELLSSLQAQTYHDWQLHARDDGSRDGTLTLLRQAAETDARVRVLEDGLGNLGTVGNFARLLTTVEGEVYLFADQDDVWLPDKIAHSLACLTQHVQAGPPGTPLLVFTDLQVVDAELRLISPSELREHGFDRMIREGLGLRRLLTQNVAAGCAMLFNRALRDAALPLPPSCVMHDWWMVLTAAATGRIAFLDEATVLYRQHGGNQMGAAGPLTRIKAILAGGASAFRARQAKACQQAEELYRRFGDRLAPEDLRACATLAQLRDVPPVLRQYLAWRAGLRRWGLLRTLAFYLMM